MLPPVTTIVLAGLALLAAGYAVLGLLALLPTRRAFAREALPLLGSLTLVVAVVAAAVLIGGPVLVLAVLALVFRCTWEAATVARLRHEGPGPLTVAGAVTALAFLAGFVPIAILAPVLAFFGAGAFFLRNSNWLRSVPHISLPTELALFPVLPLILFAAAAQQEAYAAWLLVAFALVETLDSYALGGGRLVGRTPAFPRLSPRKTVEGLVIGGTALMLTAALVGALFGLPVLACAAVALYVGGFAVAGDLAASALKRRSGVKDFPTLLRHQGGLLDIADAWIAGGAALVSLVALGGLG